MVTNDERREVAQKLRELEVGDFPDGRFYDWGEVETALGIVDYGSWYKEADVQRLADLIDRPTCFDTESKDSKSFTCSACGFSESKLVVNPFTLSFSSVKPSYRYCPKCGAAVTEND